MSSQRPKPKGFNNLINQYQQQHPTSSTTSIPKSIPMPPPMPPPSLNLKVELEIGDSAGPARAGVAQRRLPQWLFQ